MRKMFALSLVALIPLTFALAQDNPTPKGAAVKVTFPKTMKLTGDATPGNVTAHFDVKVEIKNEGKEQFPFSSADVDVKGKNLAAPQIRVQKSIDLLVIKPGKTHKSDRTVEFSMLVPEKGKAYEVEFKVFDKWYKGKVMAPK